MQPGQSDMSRYDTTTIVLHWATVALVVVQWLGAQIIDWFPKGPMRVDARSVHIVGGLLLAALLIARLVWRVTQGRHLPPQGPRTAVLLAKATHIELYLLLAAMLAVGVALTWARGDTLFNLVAIPAFEPGNRALVEQMQEIHETIGSLILLLAGLHAAAALFHHYVWRDNVLARMSPGRPSMGEK